MEIFLTAFISVVIGVAIGIFINKNMQSDSRREKSLEQELKEKCDEIASYKTRVNEHFESTANMFTSMTEQYKSMFEFMAKESKSLCDKPIQMRLEETSKPEALSKEAPQAKTNPTPKPSEPEAKTPKQPESAEKSKDTKDAAPKQGKAGAEVINLRSEKAAESRAPKDYAENN